MATVVQKRKLSDDAYLLELQDKDIAQKAKPGQFILLKAGNKRLHFTLAEIKKKTFSILFENNCKGTEKLTKLRKGDTIEDVLGPLGNPSKIERYGNVCLIGTHIQQAALYPIAEGLKQAGNKIVTVMSGPNKKSLFWEEKLSKISDKTYICTDDGSKGAKKNPVHLFDRLIRKEKLHKVWCMGPTEFMRDVSKVSHQRVSTTVSLNPILVDGTGLCGSCRVLVDGEPRLACCEGLEFDGHKIDFENLMQRNKRYKK